MKYAGEMAALAAALGWTISALCWTAAGKRVGSMVVNTVRLILALPLFLLYGWLVLGEAVPLSASPRAWILLSTSGIVGFFLCDLFLFRSFLLIGPRLAMLIFSLAPIVASVCGFYWLGETLTPLDMLGIAVALSGVTWVVLESPRKTKLHPHGRELWIGILFAFLGMLTQGIASVISKSGMQEDISPVAATEIRLIAGLICFLVLMPAVGKHRECISVFRHPKVMAILTTGAIAGPALGVAMLMYALTKIPTGLAMTFVSLTPVMIIPFSIVIFKERVSPRAILGAIVACAGSALLLR